MLEEYIELLKKQKWFLAVVGILLFITGVFLVLQKQPEAATTEFPTRLHTQTVDKQELHKKEIEKVPTGEGQKIWVDVKGAVKKEGLYELEPAARVNDAIQAAGGFAEQADKKSINLAQKLSDEAIVYVAHQGEQVSAISPATSDSETTSSATNESDKINLNTATSSDLMTISGVGEKRANDILAYRDSNGGFSSVDDLKNVSGIGEKTLENIRPYVTVD